MSKRRDGDGMTKASIGFLTHVGGRESRLWALCRAGSRIAAMRVKAAFAEECAYRRLSLWLPVAMGGGVLLSLTAAQEPSLVACWIALIGLSALAWVTRRKPGAFALFALFAAVAAGFVTMGMRTARVSAPILSRMTIATVSGFIEQFDAKPGGARFILRVSGITGLSAAQTPYRIRLSARRIEGLAPGAFISAKARLLPPARAALPGGYDFARDAYFARIGGVGSTLGRINILTPPNPAPLNLRFAAFIDNLRNRLEARVVNKLPGDTGAIAAAMVTGKRDFLSASARETIREAGIFHIITISGIQMTLVAGAIFVGMRRSLSLFPGLALNYPIKKWAAVFAIIGAICYNLVTGSRVGEERALIMTIIFFAAILVDRPSLSMRNLALAAVSVMLIEPEALAGASFQLSFAAVAALIAVWESRLSRKSRAFLPFASNRPLWRAQASALAQRVTESRNHGIGGALFATLCATSATSCFMAADFHELSPYVLIGNPLTMAMIEFFAVPAALVGMVAYPFGLDGPVWTYLGFGVALMMKAAKMLSSAPAATVYTTQFASWAAPCFALAILSMVVWRTSIFRASALVFALFGLWGALSGPKWDVIIDPQGRSAVVRNGDGHFETLGRVSAFTVEQWLRADADGRPAAQSQQGLCDKYGCVAFLPNGASVALIYENSSALIEDCARAGIVIFSGFAPNGCAAPVVIDRRALMKNGSIALSLTGEGYEQTYARASDEDRPWSPAPHLRTALVDKTAPSEENEGEGEEPLDGNL